MSPYATHPEKNSMEVMVSMGILAQALAYPAVSSMESLRLRNQWFCGLVARPALLQMHGFKKSIYLTL